jgi:hypothetical protein
LKPALSDELLEKTNSISLLTDFFTPAQLIFERATATRKACMVADSSAKASAAVEDQALYTVHPARKRLE